MTTNVLIAFYSTYGHVYRMALAVAKGADNRRDALARRSPNIRCRRAI